MLAYCLIPNHGHFVGVPADGDGLRGALSEAHRRYTRYVNFREGWRGHLWQERFHSFPMDDAHLWTAMRYIERNPVKAGRVDDPAAWRWSSAAAHRHGTADPLIESTATPAGIDDRTSYLGAEPSAAETARVDRHGRTGRPLGSERFIATAEQTLKRLLRKRRPGRKSHVAK